MVCLSNRDETGSTMRMRRQTYKRPLETHSCARFSIWLWGRYVPCPAGVHHWSCILDKDYTREGSQIRDLVRLLFYICVARQILPCSTHIHSAVCVHIGLCQVLNMAWRAVQGHSWTGEVSQPSTNVLQVRGARACSANALQVTRQATAETLAEDLATLHSLTGRGSRCCAVPLQHM